MLAVQGTQCPESQPTPAFDVPVFVDKPTSELDSYPQLEPDVYSHPNLTVPEVDLLQMHVDAPAWTAQYELQSPTTYTVQTPSGCTNINEKDPSDTGTYVDNLPVLWARQGNARVQQPHNSEPDSAWYQLSCNSFPFPVETRTSWLTGGHGDPNFGLAPPGW